LKNNLFFVLALANSLSSDEKKQRQEQEVTSFLQCVGNEVFLREQLFVVHFSLKVGYFLEFVIFFVTL
jgi:hypothetical protein